MERFQPLKRTTTFKSPVVKEISMDKNTNQPEKIIIDTDPGIDDAMAILFAFNSPEVRVEGLTTVFGNTSIEHTTANALRLVELAGRVDVPVARGAEKPLLRSYDGGGGRVQSLLAHVV